MELMEEATDPTAESQFARVREILDVDWGDPDLVDDLPIIDWGRSDIYSDLVDDIPISAPPPRRLTASDFKAIDRGRSDIDPNPEGALDSDTRLIANTDYTSLMANRKWTSSSSTNPWGKEEEEIYPSSEEEELSDIDPDSYGWLMANANEPTASSIEGQLTGQPDPIASGFTGQLVGQPGEAGEVAGQLPTAPANVPEAGEAIEAVAFLV
jgi:hypothetical protein